MTTDPNATTTTAGAMPPTTTAATAPEILTPRDAAALLHLPESSVRSLLRTGRLPGVRFGALWRIRRADVDRLFSDAAERMTRPAVPATPAADASPSPWGPSPLPVLAPRRGRPGRPPKRARAAHTAS